MRSERESARGPGVFASLQCLIVRFGHDEIPFVPMAIDYSSIDAGLATLNPRSSIPRNAGSVQSERRCTGD
jgi:hypothetical protein